MSISSHCFFKCISLDESRDITWKLWLFPDWEEVRKCWRSFSTAWLWILNVTQWRKKCRRCDFHSMTFLLKSYLQPLCPCWVAATRKMNKKCSSELFMTVWFKTHSDNDEFMHLMMPHVSWDSVHIPQFYWNSDTYYWGRVDVCSWGGKVLYPRTVVCPEAL